jgi:hypothetical protein
MSPRKPEPQQSDDGRPSDDPHELRKVAAEQAQKRAETLRQFPLPMAAEPAFVFKP